jgi:hypothetical protein
LAGSTTAASAPAQPTAPSTRLATARMIANFFIFFSSYFLFLSRLLSTSVIRSSGGSITTFFEKSIFFSETHKSG